MKVIMVLASTDKFEVDLSKFDYVIAVDGGIDFCIKNKKTPDLFIGDQDSSKAMPTGKKIILPKNKDITDFKAAVNWLEDNFENFNLTIIHGMYGRMDHFWAVVSDMPPGAKLVNNQNKIKKLVAGEYTFKKSEHKYISFFAISDVDNLTLSGFKYTLNNKKLTPKETYTISNEIIDIGKVSFTDGMLLVIESSD